MGGPGSGKPKNEPPPEVLDLIVEVKTLANQGVSDGRIAKLLGCPIPSVHQIIADPRAWLSSQGYSRKNCPPMDFLPLPHEIAEMTAEFRRKNMLAKLSTPSPSSPPAGREPVRLLPPICRVREMGTI